MKVNNKQKKKRSVKDTSSVLLKVDKRQDPILGQVDIIVNPGTKSMLTTYVAPPCVRVRLKYVADISITSTVGVRQLYLFRHNGCFDPDVTGIGGQPEGFDEWMAFYDRFRVVASKCTVRTSSTGSTSATGSYWIVIVPSGSATPFTTFNDAEASPYAVSKIFSQGGPAITMSQAVSVATLVGVAPRSVLSDITYSGTNAADPGDPTYWHIIVQAADGASTVVSRNIVELEFLVDFYDRNNGAISANARTVREAREKLVGARKTSSGIPY